MAKPNKISDSQHRISELLATLGITKTEFCKRTGINISTLSNYLHGAREPDSDYLIKLSDPFRVNPAWMMGYDVSMYMDDDYNKMVDQISTKVNQVDKDALDLVIEFHKFNDNGKAELLRYVKYLSSVDEYRR